MELNASSMDPIRFTFNEVKATAAAAVLLRQHGDRMPYMKLVKLMYLAEREALRRYGKPIFGDLYFSLPMGPIVSNVLNLIKSENEPFRTGGSHWSSSIDTERYDARLRKEPDLGSLSDSEVDLLRELSRDFSKMDQYQLGDWTHSLPEYCKPGTEPGEKAIPIHPEDILRVVGKTAEQIEEIREDAIRRRYFDSIFGS